MKNIFNRKKLHIFLPVLLIVVVFFGLVNSCHAQDGIKGLLYAGAKNTVDGVVGSLARLAVGAMGYIMDKVIGMIIDIAQYSSFVNNEQVKEGWTVVRDICNMFFILILLFIAFAVILRMESYSIKKSLPKLLIMAVLINFSRTICGIMIDFSQVVMLTFIGPITAGAGNFHNVLKIDEFLKAVGDTSSAGMTITNAVTYYVIAVIFMIISTVVMMAVLISFVMRIVMFWVYIVLSPLAFLLSSFSGGQKYAGQFWGDFTKYLLNGPVLAFFLWLSLYVLGNLDTTELGKAYADAPIGILEGANFASFVMAIGMLVGGLTISAQIGGMGASWGSSTVSNLKNKGLGAAKAVGKRVSGYDAVADRASAYMSMRKSVRDDKIRASTQRIAGKIGEFKQSVAKPFNDVADKTWGGWGRNKANRLNEEIKTGNRQLDDIKDINTIKKQDKVNIGGTNFEKRGDVWVNQGDGTTLKHEEIQDRMLKEKEIEIENKKIQKKKAEDNQKTADTWGKRGLMAAGAGIGLATGGGVLGMIYGGAVGRFGVPSLGEDIKEAGKFDNNLLAGYEATQVQKEGDEQKTKTTEEVRDTMNDSTKSIFKRMASALELISRKETDVKEIETMRTDIASKFQDKTKSAFDGAVSRNYVGASNLFKDYETHPENQRKVKDNFENGVFSLKDIDSDTLLKCGQQIAEGMKPATFKRQYDDLSDAKKKVVVNSLEQAGSYEAREKLARIETIDKAFKDPTEKVKFTQKLNIKVIQEILNEGTADQRKSLAVNIIDNGQINDKVIPKDLADRLSDPGVPASRAIMKALQKAADEAVREARNASAS